jgi:hypothetical protein
MILFLLVFVNGFRERTVVPEVTAFLEYSGEYRADTPTRHYNVRCGRSSG